MVTKTQKRAQIHMDDVRVDDTELEGLLEDREDAKEARKDSNGKFFATDKEVRDKIAAQATKPPYRVGRFVITANALEPKSVSFGTQGKTVIRIKLAGD